MKDIRFHYEEYDWIKSTKNTVNCSADFYVDDLQQKLMEEMYDVVINSGMVYDIHGQDDLSDGKLNFH